MKSIKPSTVVIILTTGIVIGICAFAISVKSLFPLYVLATPTAQILGGISLVILSIGLYFILRSEPK